MNEEELDRYEALVRQHQIMGMFLAQRNLYSEYQEWCNENIMHLPPLETKEKDD